MRRALLLLLLVPLLPVLVAPSPAYACSCIAPDPAQSVANADAIVLGAVDEVISESGAGPRGWDGVVRLRVERVFKGDVPSTVEVVNKDCNGGALGGRREQVIFLHEEDGNLTAPVCAGSGFYDEVDVVAALGEGTVPPPGRIDLDTPGPDGRALPLALGAGASLLLLVAWLWLRLARS